MPDGVDPDDLAALLAVPAEEFVAARTARVRELRAAGRRDAATALARVRKPVRLVRVVGELARRHPEEAAGAAAVAEDLEVAQAAGEGVRPLLKRFRGAVGALAARAAEQGDTVDVLEVGLALREVLADPGARAAWLGGRLLALPGDDGEGDGDDDAVAPAETADTVGEGPTAAEDATAAARAAEAETARRAEARRVAAAEVGLAREGLARAEDAHAARREALAALLAERQRLDERIDEARQALDDDAVTVDGLRVALARAESHLADLPR